MIELVEFLLKIFMFKNIDWLYRCTYEKNYTYKLW